MTTSAQPGESKPQDDDIQLKSLRARETQKITLWGVAVNLFLSAIKIIGGIYGQSQALLADGIHSLSDLASDGMVLLASHHAAKEADEDHPYGHERYETLATVGLGIMLIAVAVGIAWDAVERLQHTEDIVIPAMYTLAIAAVSIFSNEALFHATRAVARRVQSPMLDANAWHHRSDAISSIVVLVGIGAAWLGYPLFDAIAAILVAGMIAKIGYDLSMQSAHELADTALEPEMIEEVRQTILDIPDVRHLHNLRSRRMGQYALIDVHVQVAPRLSVSEGHHVAETIEKVLINKYDDITDITVHIDPENDEDAHTCRNLPLRDAILSDLAAKWSEHETFKHIEDITLHYLNGKVAVEAKLPLHRISSIQDADALRLSFSQLCDELEYISDCSLNFC